MTDAQALSSNSAAFLWNAVRTPSIAALSPASDASPPRAICIATPEIGGEARSGDIGSVCDALARAWSMAGHQVTILLIRCDVSEEEVVGDMVERYATDGISLVACSPARDLMMPAQFRSAYGTYLWLKTRAFDLVYFSGCGGCGHYALSARRLGLGFQRTAMLVGSQAPTLWRLQAENRIPEDLETLYRDALEASSVALADAVVSPSRSMIEWMGQQGWALPRNCHVLPNPSSGVDGQGDSQASETCWSDLVAAYAAPDAGTPLTPSPLPRVSIVVVTRNRPATLQQALDGLRLQTWPNLEVVLVDDGSDLPEAIASLDALEEEFSRRGWTMLRQSNRYLGAARNAGWRRAAGDYIIFHDDDNVSLPHLTAGFIGAMEHSGADIVTAAMAQFEGSHAPSGDIRNVGAIFAPIGGVFSLGFFANLYGDAHACFRRDALEKLGGFSEDHGIGHEDWELFARAALSGMTIRAIPEPLFWYRISTNSMLRARRNIDADYLRSGRPFLALLPPQLRPALALALRFGLDGIPGAGATTSAPPTASDSPTGWRQRLASMPILGPLLRAAWSLARSPRRGAAERRP